MTNHAIFICVKYKTTTVLCKRLCLVTGGGGTSVNRFCFLFSKNRVFNTYISWYLSNEKNALVTGVHFSKSFSFFYLLNSKTEFSVGTI